LKYAVEQCSFHIRGSWSKKKVCVAVRSVDRKHTCVGVTVEHGFAQTHKSLLRKVQVPIHVTTPMLAQAVVDAMKLKYQYPPI